MAVDQDATVAAAAELAHPNHMKQKLKAGKVVSAMSIRYSRGIEIVGYARAAGMDGVLIDLEHRYNNLTFLGQNSTSSIANDE